MNNPNRNNRMHAEHWVVFIFIVIIGIILAAATILMWIV
jgi:hypothetical protein